MPWHRRQPRRAYTYNNATRLATAGGATLKYNAFGQRSVQTVTGGGTHFLFGEDGTLLAERNVQGTLSRNYVYLNGMPLALVDGAGTISYVLNDHLGQPQKMANASGALSWHRAAGLFGDTVSQAVGTTAANPQRFPGQQFDPYTALHYNYYRDYDPATGRYLETDPIGIRGGMNLYAYVDNNPVGRVDPNGTNPLAIVAGACRLSPSSSAAAGAAIASGVCYVTGACQKAGEAIQQAVEHVTDPEAQRAYQESKRAYAAPEPPGLDECGKLAWQLEKEKAQVAARQVWDAKWMPGRHAEAVRQGQNAIRNIEKRMKALGCKC